MAFAKKTSEEFKIKEYINILKQDVFKFIGFTKNQFDYIFAGPPYGLPTIDLIPDLIFREKLLKKDGLFIMEHNPNHSYKNHPNYFEERNYGKTIFSFFKNIE